MGKARRKTRTLRKKRVAEPQTEPGRQILGEDSVIDGEATSLRAVVLRLPAAPQRQRGPMVRDTANLSRTQVWEALYTAMKTLRSMPDKERRFFAVKSGYPDFVRDYIDAYASAEAIAPRFQPTPQQVSQYLDILAWTRHLERRDWQILWWRSFDMSFGLIGEYIGRSDETARKRFENALTDVWTAANGGLIPLGKVGKSAYARS